MRNLVLVCLDSVRKDAYDEHAPRLSAAADWSFPQARAASSWSVPSHASILTGELPHRHGIHTHNRSYASLSRSDTFLDALPDHEALGVSANVFAGEEFGFDALFEDFETISNVCAFPQGLDVGEFVSDPDVEHPIRSFLAASVRNPHRLESLANGGLAFLDDLLEGKPVPNVLDDGSKAVLRQSRISVSRSSEPFVLFVNLMEAHTPLKPLFGYGRHHDGVPASYTTSTHDVWELMDDVDAHADYVRHWRRLYGAAVAYLDRLLSAFVEWLSTNTDHETTVVVTADHGENLGYAHEEGRVRHKSSLSEGLLHVPLDVLNPPSGTRPPTDGYLSHLDLGELLVGLAEGECRDLTRDRIPAEVIGMSAGPEPPSERAYWDRLIRCAYEGERKYVWDSLGGRFEYAIDHDRPTWQQRRSDEATIPAWATDFFESDAETTKRRAQDSARATESVSAATEARLEQLGYK